MAKGRFLAATIATDSRFNSLSTEAGLLFLMTIPHIDRDGIVTGNLIELWATVAPLQSDMRGRMADIVQEWSDCGLAVIYEAEGKPAIFFPGFGKNQRLIYAREAASKFAAPPGFRREESGLVQDNSRVLASTRDKSRQLASTRAEVEVEVDKQVEVKGHDDNDGDDHTRPIVVDLTNAPPSLLRQYLDATEQGTNPPQKFRKWFDDFTGRYTRPQVEDAIRKLAADVKAAKTNGSKWEHFQSILSANHANPATPGKPTASGLAAATSKYAAYDPGDEAELQRLRDSGFVRAEVAAANVAR